MIITCAKCSESIEEPDVGIIAIGNWFYGEFGWSHVNCPKRKNKDPRNEGERCDQCGARYLEVYWLPDSWWHMICPRAPAGLLCPLCALEKLRKMKL